MSSSHWKQETLKNVIFVFGTLVNLEKYMYARFELVQELLKEVLSRKAELTQPDVIRLLEALTHMKQQGGLILATTMQNLLAKIILTSKDDSAEVD